MKEEIGDVMIFLTNLADKLDIDPLEAAWEKLEVNRKKYPVVILPCRRGFHGQEEHPPKDNNQS
jgi:hypothetical protein